MFPRATLLAIITLVIQAAAVPVKRTTGISIPLHERGCFTTSDGVFDYTKAVRASVVTQNKYRHNLISFKANGGTLRKGAVIKELATIPSELLKRQNEPLIPEKDIFWVGTVSIGTPPVKFSINFDTGSSDLWVPGVGCKSAACAKKNKFDPSQSSTSRERQGDFMIRYGDKSTVEGPVFTETVEVAGIQVTRQYFSPVATMEYGFKYDSMDGVLGLGFPALSNLNHDPFFTKATKQGAVSQSVFSFKLASQGSELFLGGTNHELFSGDIEFHEVDSSVGFWQVPGASIQVNGKTVVQSFDTIIDSGTTLVYGPPSDVDAVYRAIGGQPWERAKGFYTFPCHPPPAISFNWGGADWEISSENISRGETEFGSGQCVGTLVGQDMGLGNDVWLLGDAFMKNVYTVFSFDETAVGFAKLA